jgi:hypothetical protein
MSYAVILGLCASNVHTNVFSLSAILSYASVTMPIDSLRFTSPILVNTTTLHPLYLEARYTSYTHCTTALAATFLLRVSQQTGFDPRTFQSVVSRYTDWATRPVQTGI